MIDELQQFIDAWPDHCAVLDRQGVITRVNLAWQQFANANAALPAAGLGVGENYFAVCERAIREGDADAVNAVTGMRSVMSGLARDFELDYPCHAPGVERWFQMRALPLPGGSGLIVLHRNISKQVRKEAEREAALASAKDANHAKTAFLTGLSHEIRTTLNAIIGFAELLHHAPASKVSDRYRDAAGHVLASGRMLRMMMDEVLDLAAIESGRIRLFLEDISLAPLLKEVQLLSMPLAAKHGIALRGNWSPSVRVNADALRLKQILLNLISNAIKYNRPSGMVLLTAMVKGDSVRIQVADTGPGIPAEHQGRLFMPFERLGKEHSGIEGTGIGLSICKRLAEAMSGEIGFSSIVGNGSLFWVDLPKGVTEA